MEHDVRVDGIDAGHQDHFRESSVEFAVRSRKDKKKKTENGATHARNANQTKLFEALRNCSLIICLGPAGTGKTRVACAVAVEALDEGRVERIILSRPAVEAGEKLGFLPGGEKEKLAPYLRPLYDELYEILDLKKVNKYLGDGTIEIAPVGHMRGRTLKHAFIVIDEAQNCTYAQLKMLVTRLGEGSTMVLTGDLTQTDLPKSQSGLAELVKRLKPIQDDDIAIVNLEARDIVRHRVVRRIAPVL